MRIKESEVLEHIGMRIDELDMDELADLHNYLCTEEEHIASDDIEPTEGWHLIPQEGSH